MKILIDAGHRNNIYDHGASARGVNESALALQISKKLKKELEKHNIICYLTRDSEDDIISLSERTNRAKALNVDLLLSIHINSASSYTAKGVEVLYKRQEALAKSVCSSICLQTGATSRGNKQRNDLHVLNYYNNSILVECGFISNKEELNNLLDSNYQDKIVKGIANAIVRQYKIVVDVQDTELINAVNTLIKAGLDIDYTSWCDINKMNMRWAETLILKIGSLFGIKSYKYIISFLLDKGAITDRDLWDKKEFVAKYIRVVLIRVSKLV